MPAQIKTKLLAEARDSAAPIFRMSGKNAELDRHGDRVFPGALHLADGAKDLILYWSHGHQQGKFPVGRAKAWESNGEWFMTPVFSDATDEARQCAALVADGTLRACSIGYLTEVGVDNGFGGEDVHRAELVEVSIVGIPAKPEAVRVKAMDDETKKALATMSADLAEMKKGYGEMGALVKALHEKQFPPEKENEEETKEATTDDPDADHADAPPPPADDDAEPEGDDDEEADEPEAVAAKFFNRIRVKRSA